MRKFQKVSLKIEVIGIHLPEIHFVPRGDNDPLGVNTYKI